MTKREKIISCIQEGRGVLGIEFGSTRIKAVLIDENHNPIAAGDHEWENRLENGVWTYRLEEIWEGLQDSYDKLAEDVKSTYQIQLTRLGAIGFSGMMHGYMAFDREEKLLVPFRTWRNTMTEEAAAVGMLCLQHSAAVEHRTSVSGDFKGRGACGKNRLFKHPRRLHPLEADRTARCRNRRGIRDVPHRLCNRRL